MKKIFLLLYPIYCFAQSSFSNTEFIKVEEINISNDILIAEINYLDVSDVSNILITDNMNNSVYIINDKGKLIKTLDPNDCHPGFHWSPYLAKYTTYDEIIVLNSYPWGFRFDKVGNCLGPMGDYFEGTNKIASFDNKLVGLYLNKVGVSYDYHIKIMEKNGSLLKRFGEFPDGYENIIYRLEGGGLECDNNGNIYQVNSINPKIIKYDITGKQVKEFNNSPTFFKYIDKISPNTEMDLMNFIKKIGKIVANNTLIENIYMLNNRELLVSFINNQFIGYQVISTDGKTIKEGKLYGAENKLLVAKRDKLYLVQQPEIDKKGNLPNPKIVILKFNTEK